MTTTTLQQQARALGDPTRHAIYRRIAQAGGLVGVADLNEHFPLHHNAIRQHLAKLVGAGLLIESRTHLGGRGRPRLVYEPNPAVEGPWGTSGPYERLSRLLVEVIRTGDTPQVVGRRAASLYKPPSPSGDVLTDLEVSIARQGFNPEVRRRHDGAEIILRVCPIADVALADRDTVCALHLGVAQGLIGDAAMAVTELVAQDPRQAACRLRIRALDDTKGQPSARLTLRGGLDRDARSADEARDRSEA